MVTSNDRPEMQPKTMVNELNSRFALTAEHIKLAQRVHVHSDGCGGLFPGTLPRFQVILPEMDEAVKVMRSDVPRMPTWEEVFEALGQAKAKVTAMANEMNTVMQIVLDNAGTFVEPGEYMLVDSGVRTVHGPLLRWRRP